MASELIVSARTSRTFHQFTKTNDGKYYGQISKLVLENDAVLVLPDRLSGEEVVLKIDELIVNGNGYIAQTNGTNLEVVRGKQPVAYWKQSDTGQSENIFRAPKGPNGNAPEQRPQSGSGSNGKNGDDGKTGIAGKNSISHLTLDLNIKSIDKLKVVLIAQSGGTGGDGGAGQDGAHATCGEEAGADGGTGGRGGRGGDPGRTGDVTIYWNSDLPILRTGNAPRAITVLHIPGISGSAGSGGDAGGGGDGKGCFPLFSRSAGDNGNPGEPGPIYRDNEYWVLGTMGKTQFFSKDEL